jgi:hypothetical protein
VYPKKTSDHVDKRHSPTSVGTQNKYTQTLGQDKGKIMVMSTVETAVANDTVKQDGSRTVYEAQLGGFFTSVGTQGEDTNRVVTQDLETILDPSMLESVAQEMADPATLATISALEAANPDNKNPVKVEVVVTQHPIHDTDRMTK